jgi:VWFA-related protein
MLLRMTLRRPARLFRIRALLISGTILLAALPPLADMAAAQSASGPVLRIPGQKPAQQQSPPPASTTPASEAAPSTGKATEKAASPAPAKTTPDKTTEVRVFAVVRDKKGRPVADLSAQDFVLETDDRSQSDFQLGSASAFPLTIGLAAETLPGESKEVSAERKHGAAFFQRLLRAGTDRGFVLHFDRQVELLQDVTSSQEKLERGVKLLAASGSAPGRERGSDGSGAATTRFYFGGNTLYDAIYLSAHEVLRGWPGRRVLVVFSSGVDQQSKVSLLRAIEAAQRAGAAVYCVYVPGNRTPERHTEIERPGGYPGGYPRSPIPGTYPGGYPRRYPGGYPGGGPFPGGQRAPGKSAERLDGRKILRQIAEQTGGGYFDLGKENAEKIFARIEDQLRHQYSLSFPAERSADGYHSLRLTTKKRELSVEAPAGVYAEPGSAAQ